MYICVCVISTVVGNVLTFQVLLITIFLKNARCQIVMGIVG